MRAHVIGLAGDYKDTTVSHIKSFPFDPNEITYSTGWVVMANHNDGKQSGNATLTIEKKTDNDYLINFSGSFINKRKLDGDTFFATLRILDKNGKEIETLQIKRGLDATIKKFFKTQRGGRAASINITDISNISSIYLTLGYHDRINDQKFWEKATEIAQKVYEAYKKQEDEKEKV